jgi:hypothetical protein
MSATKPRLVDAYFDAASDLASSRAPQAEAGHTLVLFDGGDNGGILLSGRGVRPIPAFDPALRLTLESVAMLMTSVSATQDRDFAKKLGRKATELCNLAIAQLEQLLGPLDRDRGLVYQCEHGGFTCGAAGRPPLAFSWPPKSSTSVTDLISAGVVRADLVELLQRAAAANVDIFEVFEDPRAIARRLGVALSEKSADDLGVLAPSRLGEIEDEVDREIYGFLHAVAKHGGYWQVCLDRPQEAARALGVELSDAAIERIGNRGAAETFVTAVGPLGLAVVGGGVVVVGVVVIAYAHYAEHKVAPSVMDGSGLEKF